MQLPETEPVAPAERVYRYGQWQEGRTSRWVIECAECSIDDEHWMIRFDQELNRMVRCTWRSKAAAERACNDHFNGNHDDRGDQ